MRLTTTLLGILSAMSAFGLEDGILFRADFDRFMTTAVDRNGPVESCEGIPKDLQFRMHPGMDGKGNSLTLTTSECVSWPAAGHLRPDRGTVSFWVKPCNYVISDAKRFQPYFVINARKMHLYVYKYGPWGNRIVALYVPDKSRPRERYFLTGSVDWREDEWHRVDFAWDPNGAALYVDGREPAQPPEYPPVVEMDAPLPFARELEDGVITLDNPTGWQFLDMDRMTAFDDVEIRDYRMTAKEVHAATAKRRPDLAATFAGSETDRDPVRLSYTCDPAQRRLLVRLDFEAVRLPWTKDFPVRLSLSESAGGPAVLSEDVVFPSADSEVPLAFADRIRPGRTYTLSAEIKGTSYRSSARFRVPKTDFLSAKVGVGHDVPSPWTPVTETGDRAFSVLDRTYEFRNGVLPSRIVSRGRELLVRPPALEADGKPVVWERVRVGERQPDVVRLSAEGRAGGLLFRGKARLWFDGFCEIGLELKSADGQASKIESLRLRWSTPSEEARYLLMPMFRPWKGDRYDCRLGFEFDDHSLVWTTGCETGLAWYRDSNANWVEDGTKANVRLARGERETAVEVDVIARPVTLAAGRSARYVMGFQGTPSKPCGREHRSRLHGQNMKECDWTWSGWSVDGAMLYTSTLTPSDPAAFRTFLSREKAKGVDDVTYSMPMHISPEADEWDYFYPTWARVPAARWDIVEPTTKKKTHVMQCCGNTGAEDWDLGHAKKLFEDFPDLNGVYLDCSNVEYCRNERHGHGGTDAFGQPFVTSLARSHRDYLLRFVRLCRQHGNRLYVHAHNKYFPFVHSLADGCMPGEEQTYPYIANPRTHYQEAIPEAEYQSAWNCTIRGMGIYAIPQNVRARTLAKETVDKDFDAYLGKTAILGGLPMSGLIYDFQCMGLFHEYGEPFEDLRRRLKPLKLGAAAFHAYWIEPHARTSANVRTALYTWKPGEGAYPFLLVLANFGCESVATGLALDWTKTGSSASRLRDLMTDKTYDEAELASARLPSHEFMLLVPLE